ncbi:hypothetical protein Tco_1540932 [Tanacetum coccineum]
MSKRRERIMARKEIVLPLLLPLPPPLIIHHPLITSMMIMIRMTKVALVLALLLPFVMSTLSSTQASSSNPPKKIKFTLIPLRKLFVDLTQEDDETHTPSPIEKSSSPSLPNAPSKTPSTKDTSSTFGTTSSSFESKPCSLPFSSRNKPSPQPTNSFHDDPLDAPPRPSNPLPLQSHPSLDITLSFSTITPLDNMFETPSPPLPPPPPQPPLMGHPIYFNILYYHGAHCLCCFHNRNLILSLRDKMHFMFSHVEYLLTSAIASPSPHHH